MPRPRWPDSTNSVSDEPGTLQTVDGGLPAGLDVADRAAMIERLARR